MKYITLIIGLLVVGCLKQEQTNQNQIVTTNTNEASEPLPAKPPLPPVMPNPTKELTLREKVVGTYEYRDERTLRLVFLKNGVMEAYKNGKKRETEHKWKTVEGGIHTINVDGSIDVVRINKDDSITRIAAIDEDGKREELSKDRQRTFKKIK